MNEQKSNTMFYVAATVIVVGISGILFLAFHKTSSEKPVLPPPTGQQTINNTIPANAPIPLPDTIGIVKSVDSKTFTLTANGKDYVYTITPATKMGKRPNAPTDNQNQQNFSASVFHPKDYSEVIASKDNSPLLIYTLTKDQYDKFH